ncbi:MAG: hypothetical protein ACK53Q_24685 [Dolichospermum sp.]|jgi:hypothetical protein
MDDQRIDQPSVLQRLQQNIYEQGLEIFLDLLLPLLIAILCAYVNYAVKNNIAPYLKHIAEKIQINKKPTFTPAQEAEIKGYIRSMLAESLMDRVSLFFLDNPSIQSGGLIKADSFTLWIAGKKNKRSNEPNNQLSFAFVSEELNRLVQEDRKIASYDKAEDGKVCFVWLRSRGTKKYTFYRTNGFGFLILEKVQNISLKDIEYFLSRKNFDCLDFCTKIDQVILEALGQE